MSAWGFNVEGWVWIGRWEKAESFQQIHDDVSHMTRVPQSEFELRLPGETEPLSEETYNSLRSTDTLVIIHRKDEDVFEIDCRHLTDSPRLSYVIRPRAPGMTVRELQHSVQEYITEQLPRWDTFKYEVIALFDSHETQIPPETMVDALPTQLKAFIIYNPDSLEDLATDKLPDMATFLNSEPSAEQMQFYLKTMPKAPEDMLRDTFRTAAFPSAVRAVQSLPDSEQYTGCIRHCKRLRRNLT